jgi:hypothetical protein
MIKNRLFIDPQLRSAFHLRSNVKELSGDPIAFLLAGALSLAVA